MSVIVINSFLSLPGGDPSSLFVLDAGISDAIGLYPQTGTVAGRPKYTNSEGFYIQFNSSYWELFDNGNNLRYATAPGDGNPRGTYYSENPAYDPAPIFA